MDYRPDYFEAYNDEQLVNFWNRGDGSISWLNRLEEELKLRGYEVRSTDPDDGRPRIGGERLQLAVKYPQIRKRQGGTIFVAARSQDAAEECASRFGVVKSSRWSGPGFYRSDVYRVETV